MDFFLGGCLAERVFVAMEVWVFAVLSRVLNGRPRTGSDKLDQVQV